MRFRWRKNPYVCGGLALFLAAAASILFYKILSDFNSVLALFSKAGSVLMPFIVGLILAYLLSPIYDRVQKPIFKLLAGKGQTPRKSAKPVSKVVATIVSILFLLGVVVAFFSLVIPQGYASVVNLVETSPAKTEALIEWVREVGNRFGNGDQWVEVLLNSTGKIGESLSKWAQEQLLPNLGNMAAEVSLGIVNAITTVLDVIVGVIICVYTLNSKELFAAQAKKVTYAMFKTSTANYLIQLTRYIDQTFGRYINGTLIDALVVGVLCFLGMAIMRMPYALLVSTIVGVTNIVPIFGPIVGAVIGAFFILLDSPIKALVFLIFVMVLQQIDGNILKGILLGGQTGLKSFWVIFAIVVGGGMFGFWGLVLGVPLFAVVYALFQKSVVHRLRRKEYPDDTAAYDGLWEIDSQSGEIKYDRPEDDVAVPESIRRRRHSSNDSTTTK